MAFGPVLATPGALAARYAEGLLKDVRADQFARLPVMDGKTIQTNHPAWVYGHCCIYFARVTTLCGGTPKASITPAHYEALFKDGTVCRDDAAGSIYPAMAEIVEHFRTGHKEASEALRAASDATLLAPNMKDGKVSEMLPTLGSVANFLLSAHCMTHLGQVSAWRRMMGLGSAF